MKTARRMKEYRGLGVRIALAFVPALVVLVALGLTGWAGSGRFDDSAVVPTADEVDVGDEVGLALYVVNSDTVTATAVLAWNPIPEGTTYVSASGGAFPVVGGVVNDEPVEIPAENHAYDVRRRTSVPLGDAGEVTGIGWVGNIAPGAMAVPGLIVAVDDPGARFVADELFVYDDRVLAARVSAQVWVRPHALYLPGVSRGLTAPLPTPTNEPAPVTTTVTFTIPYGRGLGFGAGSLDPNYDRALAGVDLRLGDAGVYLGQSPPDGPYIPWYAVGRAYAGWDTSPIPDDATIVSTTLILDVGCNPPATDFRVTIYRDSWEPPLSEDDWHAIPTHVAGTWHTADYPCTGCPAAGRCLVRIELDPDVIDGEGVTLVEMRSDREGTPPVTPEQVLVYRSDAFPALLVTYSEAR